MTRVDFYVLSQADEQQRHIFAARLCEKALQQQLKTLLIVDTEHLQSMDELLWHYRPESFVPHALAGQHSANDSVLISDTGSVPDFDQLIINLSTEIPKGFSHCQRCAEIVCQTPPVLASTRSHYAYYTHRGYPVNTHKISSNSSVTVARAKPSREKYQ